MQFVRRDSGFIYAALLVLALAACSGQKDAARNSVWEITAVVSAAEPEAATYVPDQLKDVQARLAALRKSLDGKDYAAVLAAAPTVLAGAQSLATAAAAKKDQILKDQNDSWTNLAAVLPDEVTALQTRLEQLGRKPAKGVDVAAVGSSMADVTSLWSKAQAAFAGGNLEEAVSTAKDVKSKADALATALKIEVKT